MSDCTRCGKTCKGVMCAECWSAHDAACERLRAAEQPPTPPAGRGKERVEPPKGWEAVTAALTDLPAALALIADLLDVIYTMRGVLSDDNWSCDPRDVASGASSPFDTPAWRSAATALRKEST